ncbi:MAG: glyoxalase/bleomycin resistance/extradiol dioxygenase family protein [Firmicutes bacterium]|nr:glyoxalase/bleomycin resistance/extradiol dioxygenase family protein [Dethiobacter sp.]MBS3889761.1 glyoxalase/bleomycin resistance/extradiol dioxygenase family protein [Bacillota bacterium]MBS4054906.1 glyoxalase/bleomycin resistance/extradiol dioxygenase family protein [Thermaerobacter sp.]
MGIHAYLTFNGHCRQAYEFYAEVFSAEKGDLSTYGDAPPNPEFSLPDEAKQLIIHGELTVHGTKLMFSDTFPGSPFVVGNNITLALVLSDADAVKAAFQKLREGGQVLIDLQETFWSKCYGSVVDKFGITWGLNCINE